MFQRIEKVLVRSKHCGSVAAVALFSLAGTAYAQTGPPEIGDLELPVNLGSIVAVALAAVAAMLIIIIGPTLGLSAVKGIINWAKSFSKGKPA